MKRLSFLFLLLIPLMFSCTKEPIDYGRSYLRLTYYDIEPYYIESQLSDFFYWDEDYRVSTGNYSLYYEGDYYDYFGNLVVYAWEIYYEIYRYKDYYDAPDVYFTIECNPEGPYMYEEIYDKSLKPDEYEIEKENEGYKLKLKYKRVEPRNHK
jgi:hypothetical protein